MRRSRRWGGAVIVGLVLGTASLVAATAQLDDAAEVRQPARRVEIPDVPDRTPEERAAFDLVDLVNGERLRRGLPVLNWHPQVAAAARAHSVDMASNGRLQHAGSDGSDAGGRLSAAGFAWIDWGENVADGHLEPGSVFAAWMGVDDQRRHLLGDHVFVGVGAVADAAERPYWTLVVAS